MRPVVRVLTAAPTTWAGLPTGSPEKKTEAGRMLSAQLDVSLGRFERATFRSVASDPSLVIYPFFHSVSIGLVGDYLHC